MGPGAAALAPKGKVRLALDWTLEGTQPLRVVALVTGGRAVPRSWRACAATVWKGRRHCSETAVLRRALTRVQRERGQRRVRVTAARGFAEVALGDVLTALGGEFSLRVQGPTKGCVQGPGRKLRTRGFAGNTRRRPGGRVAYGERAPHRVEGTLSRAREAQGQWEVGDVSSTRCRRAHGTAQA
jgi:hypothetical protein